MYIAMIHVYIFLIIGIESDNNIVRMYYQSETFAGENAIEMSQLGKVRTASKNKYKYRVY